MSLFNIRCIRKSAHHIAICLFAAAVVLAFTPVLAQGAEEKDRPDYHWESIGPYGGDRFMIHMHPDDHETLYCVGHGGVHKSINAAASWTPIYNQQMQGTFLAFAFHPDDPERIYTASTSSGVFESMDGGENWRRLANGMPNQVVDERRFPPVSSLAFDSNRFLYAANSTGAVRVGDTLLSKVYRYDFDEASWLSYDEGLSDDGNKGLFFRGADGALWLSLYGGGCFELVNGSWQARGLAGKDITFMALHPDDGDTFFAGTGEDWIYMTADRGETWERLALPELLADVDPTTLPLVYDLAIDPNNTNLMLIGCSQAGGSNEQPLFTPNEHQHSAGGKLVLNLASDQYTSVGFGPNTLYCGFHTTFDPHETYDDPNFGRRSKVAYYTSGGRGCVVKFDGNTGRAAIQGINGVHLNHVFVTHDGVYLGAAEQGIVADFGNERYAHWSCAETLIYTWCIARDYSGENTYYYGTGNPAWSWSESRGLYRLNLDDMFGLKTDPRPYRDQILTDTGIWEIVTFEQDPDLIYLGTQNDGFLISNDGENFTELNEGLVETSVCAVCADYNGLVFAGTRTSDGNTWEGNYWSATKNENGDLYVYDDDIERWKSLGIGKAVYGICKVDDEMMCATSVGVIASLDGGVTWSWCETPFDGRAVADVVHTAGRFYAGVVGAGVFRTEDLGETWTNVTGDLPNFAIDDMLADPNVTGRVMVATLGSSGFALEDR